jgi:hypothetical protein
VAVGESPSDSAIHLAAVCIPSVALVAVLALNCSAHTAIAHQAGLRSGRRNLPTLLGVVGGGAAGYEWVGAPRSDPLPSSATAMQRSSAAIVDEFMICHVVLKRDCGQMYDSSDRADWCDRQRALYLGHAACDIDGPRHFPLKSSSRLAAHVAQAAESVGVSNMEWKGHRSFRWLV